MEAYKLIAILTPILIAAATAYLRLFIRNEINEVLQTVKKELVSKDVFDAGNQGFDHRLNLLESKSARR